MTTPKQEEFLKSLVEQKEIPDTHKNVVDDPFRAGLSTQTASEWIEYLLTLPNKPKRRPTFVDPPLGMHKVGFKVFKVYETRKGHVVSKVLTGDDDGDWVFSYRGKAGLKGLSETTVMDAATAAAFGKTYGICVRCAAHLTDERSIFVGYGPVCAERESWPYPTPTEAIEGLALEAVKAAEAAASAALALTYEEAVEALRTLEEAPWPTEEPVDLVDLFAFNLETEEEVKNQNAVDTEYQPF